MMRWFSTENASEGLRPIMRVLSLLVMLSLAQPILAREENVVSLAAKVTDSITDGGDPLAKIGKISRGNDAISWTDYAAMRRKCTVNSVTRIRWRNDAIVDWRCDGEMSQATYDTFQFSGSSLINIIADSRIVAAPAPFREGLKPSQQ